MPQANQDSMNRKKVEEIKAEMDRVKELVNTIESEPDLSGFDGRTLAVAFTELERSRMYLDELFKKYAIYRDQKLTASQE